MGILGFTLEFIFFDFLIFFRYCVIGNCSRGFPQIYKKFSLLFEQTMKVISRFKILNSAQ